MCLGLKANYHDNCLLINNNVYNKQWIKLTELFCYNYLCTESVEFG